MADPRGLYLDLLKQSLTNSIYGEPYQIIPRPRAFLKQKVFDLFDKRGIQLMRRRPFDPQVRAEGRDWPAVAHTMIGLQRLDNLQFCVEDVLATNIPGDLMEAGVWRGGASIFMRAILKAHNVTDRRVWVADSFQGLPQPNQKKFPADARARLHTLKFLAVPLEEVKANFNRYGLLDEQVRFLPGWFRDTLPTTSGQRWAVIRLDADLYESTTDALVNLYPNLSVGGYVSIDDYGGAPACRRAVDDYRDAHRIEEEIRTIDWTGVFWQRAR
ncbi:MAG: TylF/MycF family methyltransferase [Candidatus Acidoferrales bacterium]